MYIRPINVINLGISFNYINYACLGYPILYNIIKFTGTALSFWEVIRAQPVGVFQPKG